MAFARDVYAATAAQTDFVISFPYLSEADVFVFQEGVELTQGTDYTFFSSSVVRLTTGATEDDTIIVQRKTSQDARLVDFVAGLLGEADLDNDSLQGFFMAQEALDIADTAMSLDTDDNWTAQSRRIKNVTDPTAAQDATTKTYVDSAIVSAALGTLPVPVAVAQGGTGSATAAGARTNLGVPADADVAKLASANQFTATQKFSKGADIASPAGGDLTLGADGNYFDITGTNAITSIDTVGIGATIKLHFDGALVLTHSATDLILPGGASITTAAGDEAEFVEYAAGDWRCTNYVRAALGYQSASVVSGSAVAITTNTSKTVTSITLTPGTWDISAAGYFSGAGSTTVTATTVSISEVTDTLDTTVGRFTSLYHGGGTPLGSANLSAFPGPVRVTITANTTYYLVVQATFGVDTMAAFGMISAKRIPE
jgi:hypothetical protein